MSDAREYELEIFRADTAASKGITAADIAHVATTYDATKNPAPLVKGHPEHDKPAVGLITSVRAEGNRLFAKVGNIAADVLQGIRDKAWINRSVAFWHPEHPSNPTPGKYSLRHLGLLGASTPAIAGMEPMRFTADELAIEIPGDPQPAVIFTVEPTKVVTIEEKRMPDPIKVEETAEFKAERTAREAAEARIATFEADAKKARERGNAEFVAKLVEGGKLPAGHAKDLETVFNALPTDELTFAAHDDIAERKETPLAFLQRLFDAAKPQVVFEAVSPKGKAKTGDEGPDLSTADGVRAAANAFIAEQKAKGIEVSFMAAVEHIEAQGA